jgi:hypothetical protein
MCDGKNRLKAEAGMVPFLEGKGGRGRKPSQFLLKTENGRVLEITILITRYSFHHGYGDAFRARAPYFCLYCLL